MNLAGQYYISYTISWKQSTSLQQTTQSNWCTQTYLKLQYCDIGKIKTMLFKKLYNNFVPSDFHLLFKVVNNFYVFFSLFLSSRHQFKFMCLNTYQKYDQFTKSTLWPNKLSTFLSHFTLILLLAFFSDSLTRFTQME